MTQEIEFSCRCQKVAGRVTNASPRTVNRVVCYCDDCQAFLHHLGRADLLDAHGGTDIVQVAPATVTLHRGSEHIQAVRLTAKGLFRWYAACCNTPIGNSTKPKLPFIGMNASAFAGGASGADAVFGKPVGAFLGRFAVGDAPPGSTGLNPRLIVRAIATILGWRIRGKGWPNPFFERETSRPKYPVSVLASAQREALRPLCGPRPAQGALAGR